jgi:hypothetical protein
MQNSNRKARRDTENGSQWCLLRQHFVGVQDTVGIKHTLHGVHNVDRDMRLAVMQVVRLADTDSVCTSKLNELQTM